MRHSAFTDIVHDLEKISDHCSNIAIYTIQLVEGAPTDTHPRNMAPGLSPRAS